MNEDDCGQHHQMELEHQQWLVDPDAQREYRDWLNTTESQNKDKKND